MNVLFLFLSCKLFSKVRGQLVSVCPFWCYAILLLFLPARASEQGNVIGVGVRIGECGSTLYVGLSRMVRNLIQKSTV